MKTEQIRLALLVAREKSITKAAQAMIISQPTASNLLKVLEQEVGYRIFHRDKGNVLPTEEGKVFLEQAVKIEQALNAISQAAQNVRQINFVVISYHIDFTAQAFEAICERYHSVGYTRHMQYQQVSNIDEAAKMVANGNGDVAIVVCQKKMFDFFRRKYDKDYLEAAPICELPMTLVFPKGHPILQDGNIRFDLIRQYPGFSGISRLSLEPYLMFSDARLVGQAQEIYNMDPCPMRYRLLHKTNGILFCLPISENVKNEYDLESVSLTDAMLTVFAVFRRNLPNESLINEYLGLCTDFCHNEHE